MPIDPRYDTFGARFGAGIIDGFLFSPLIAVDLLVFQEGRPVALIAAWAVVSFLSFSVYSVFMHARFGQTIGKMITRVKVMELSERSVPGLRRALLREYIYILMMVFWLCWFLVFLFRDGIEKAYWNSDLNAAVDFIAVAWLGLELVTMLTNNRRRALHDVLGGTVVVKFEQADEPDPGKAAE